MLKGWVSMMVALNVMAYFKISLSTRNWDRAELMGMPKSSVSQKISRLESQLGVPLLQRTTRSLSLTSQGEIYAEHCLSYQLLWLTPYWA